MGQIHRMLGTALLGLGLLAPAIASAHDGDWDHDHHDGDWDHDDHHDGDWDHDDHHDDHDWDHGHGWHGVATLTVRNTFDGEARVVVDQKPVGTIGGDRSASFQVNAGWHDVRVTRPNTNFVLAQTHVEMNGGTIFQLPVQTPTTSLRLENTGEVPLKVQVGS